MALTRPRYSQIPDSDYKNSCRIVTTTNVSLTGSAPLTYDGVTLVQYDRVLVAGQTDKTQNGIYSVSTLGSGSNGTWVRSKDANANDRLTAGMNTFIEEGTYTGQFWHLLTPGPIVLGVTELIFGQITGNAAGTSSQVQYNSSGSIAGAANLRYDAATGNVLIGGGTVSTSNVTGALTVNGGLGVTGEIWAQGNIYSIGSRVLTAYDLETVTFLANYISKDPANVYVPVVGTGTIYGTHNFGNLEAISTFGDYNTTAQSGYYSVNDASGAPGFVVYAGFTGINDFNRAVYNINYTQSSGHTITIDLYNYDTDAWDALAQYSGSGSWQTFALSVIDANPYIDATGNVTTRIYHVSSGNTAHRTWIDYIALEKSITGGSGPRGATGPTGPSGTYSGGYISGVIITGGNITTSGNFVSNSSNISISTTTGALVLTGNGGAGIGGNIFAGGNITANAFYTVNGLFWEGNGLAFSSGLEVSEINAANTLSNISSQVTSIRFDKDTGFSVTELDPGNVKISLGSSFKTWHVPGQADLVAAAEDEVTFFGNGIDITTHPTYPKSITFISNNSILEANIGAFYNYANANIGTLYLGNISTNANLGAYQTWANVEIAGAISEISALTTATSTNAGIQATAINLLNANLGAYQLYANANVGSIYNNLNILDANIGAYQLYTNANIVSYQVYANANIGSIYNNLNALDANVGSYQLFANANLATQTTNYDTLNANIGAFYNYANTIIGPSNSGNLVVNATTESVSAVTGALVVKGGAGIGGNLYVTGNIYAANLTAISVSTLSVTDPLLYLTASNPYPYNYDIGFFSHYSTTPGFEQHTGIARDYTTNTWGFFSNLSLNPGAVVDWAEANLIYDTVRLGELIVSNSTTSTSTTTGALRVSGGVGISGTLFINNTGDVSANIGNLYLADIELNANLGAYQTWANNEISTINTNASNYQTFANANLGISTTFTVTNSGSSHYVVNSETNPTIYLIRGQTYNFVVNAIGHAFWIKTAPSIGIGDQYNDGVTNNGEDNGTVSFLVPLSAPDVLYYISQADASLTGQINVVNFSSLDANIGAYQVYANANASSIYNTLTTLNSNVGAYQSYANANIGSIYNNLTTLDANVGAYQTFANANLSTQTTNYNTLNANIGAFYTYANTLIGPDNTGNLVVNATTDSISQVTGALVVKGGAGIAGNIYSGGNIVVTNNVSANKFYTTSGIYWSGNGESYSSGGGITYTAATSAPVAPTVGDQWYDTAEGILYEYMDDGDTNQWVDIVTPTFSSSNPIAFSTDVSFGSNINVEGNIFITDGIFWSVNGAPYSTGGGGGGPGEDAVLRANVGAYQIYANANIGTLYLGNVSTNANLGAYQTWANSNFGTSTYSNTNVAAYLTQGASVGSGSTTANLVVAATTESTDTTTGALVVAGGMGVAGNIFAQGNVILGYQGTSNVVVAATTGTTSTTTGALVVRGGVGIGTSLYVGLTTYSQVFQATSSTDSTSPSTGALKVPSGGAGIAGNLFVNGNVIVGSGTNSNLVANATTVSTSTTTGALVVRGGMGIAGAAYIGGALNITSSTSSTTKTTGALVVTGGVGVGGSINVNGGSTTAGWTVGGLLQTTSSTPATSSSSGALYVAGGAGIVGNLYVDGNVILGTSTTSNLVANATTTSTSTTTGALVVRGGAGVAGNLNVGGNVSISGNVSLVGAISGGVGYLLERANIVSASAPATTNIDLLGAPVMYWSSNCTANITANIRGNATTPLNSIVGTNQTATFALFLPNGAVPYFVNTVKIDNATITPVWLNGNTLVSGNADSIDVYTFTVIKTASATYKVFATQSKFQHTG